MSISKPYVSNLQSSSIFSKNIVQHMLFKNVLLSCKYYMQMGTYSNKWQWDLLWNVEPFSRPFLVLLGLYT